MSPFPSEKESQENLSFLQDDPFLSLTEQSTFLVYFAPSWVEYVRLSPAPTVIVVEDLALVQVKPLDKIQNFSKSSHISFSSHLLNMKKKYLRRFTKYSHIFSPDVAWSVVVAGEDVVAVVVLLSPGIKVPVQVPLGRELMLVTSSGLIVALVSIGGGWIVSRSLLISSSSVWTPSTFPLPLTNNTMMDIHWM